MPSAKAVKASVFKGLGIRGDLTSALVTYVEFEPTLGIVAGRIDKLSANIQHFREPLERAIREVVMPSIDANFQAGGRPAWEPLSAATEEIRDRLGGNGNGILDKTGALRTGMWNIDNWTITDGFAVMSKMPVWYGKLMQEGYNGKGGGSKVKLKEGQTVRQKLEEIVDRAVDGGGRERSVSPIPARPFVMLQPEDEDAITEIFIDWLGQQVDDAWPGV